MLSVKLKTLNYTLKTKPFHSRGVHTKNCFSVSRRISERTQPLILNFEFLIPRSDKRYILRYKKSPEQHYCQGFDSYCGEGGIRTLGTRVGHTRFPGEPVRPLRHLSFHMKGAKDRIILTR